MLVQPELKVHNLYNVNPFFLLPQSGYDSDSEEENEWKDYQGEPEVSVTAEKESPDVIWRSKFVTDESLNGDSNIMANLETSENMYEAISNGNVERVRKLLNDGVGCDEPLSVNFGSSGRRPIFIAAEEGHVEILELLLDYGCRLDAEEGNFTPLMSTCGSVFLDREEALAECVGLLAGKAVEGLGTIL